MAKGQNPVFNNPEELAKKIRVYFDICENEDPEKWRPPTLAGLALHLGVSRKTLSRYISDCENGGEGKRSKGNAARCAELLMLAKGKIEKYLEEALVTRHKGTHGIEFALMNGFGWGEKSTVDLKGGVELEHKEAPETAISRLSDEELLEHMRIVQARLNEIMKREGLTDGADG